MPRSCSRSAATSHLIPATSSRKETDDPAPAARYRSRSCGHGRLWRLVEAEPADDRCGAHVRADRLPAVGSGRGRQADASLVQDHRSPTEQTLTQFKQGPGPHTGVHLIIVRKDLATIIHRHPPIAPDGTISETVVFTKPGPYRVVVDVYPRTGPQPNFQLTAVVARRGGLPPAEAPSVHLDRRGRRLSDHDARSTDAACDPGGRR